MLFDFIANGTNISIMTLIHVFVKTETIDNYWIVWIIQLTISSLKPSTKIFSLEKYRIRYLLPNIANNNNWRFCL